MSSKTATVVALILLAAGCQRAKEPTPQSLASEGVPQPSASTTPQPVPAPSAPATETPPPPDKSALDDRNAPDRLLRTYAAALHARDWATAAKA